MKIVELILNEEDENAGIDAVSLVEKPAIESDWVALKKHEVQLKTINEDKRLLMGAALIPNKQIYRRNEKTNEEYYIFFSKDTVRKASQLFLKESNQNNATIEHTKKISGMSVVESWIKEGEQDKSNLYGFDAEPGTWFITMKVENSAIWDKVKSKEIKGFSIEGYFAEKLEASKEEFKSVVVDEDIAIIDDRNAYSTKEKALQVAKDVGCEGYHEHEFEGKTWFMPCEQHTNQLEKDAKVIEELKKMIKEYETKKKKKKKKKYK